MEIFLNNEWVELAEKPKEGDLVREVDANGITKKWTVQGDKPLFQILNISVSGHKRVRDGIYDLPENALVTITGEIQMEDTVDPMVIMIEKLKDGVTPVDDSLRFEATINSSVFTLPIKLPTGNFLLSAERLNKGLDNLNKGFHVAFDSIEFDSIVSV